MGMFTMRKPRGFRHEYIYVDERKEKLQKIEETAKLVPPSLQLSPLLQIGILLTGLVKLLLGCYIAVFHTETTLLSILTLPLCALVLTMA